jgi:hypothetical protein
MHAVKDKRNKTVEGSWELNKGQQPTWCSGDPFGESSDRGIPLSFRKELMAKFILPLHIIWVR